ncbi:unnamed protein product, partial [Rotaria sordida]
SSQQKATTLKDTIHVDLSIGVHDVVEQKNDRDDRFFFPKIHHKQKY